MNERPSSNINESQGSARTIPMPQTPWPHAPRHELSQNGTYFVTVGTYCKQHDFRGADRLGELHRSLLTIATKFGWQLEAWAVFLNHYHIVAHSPASEQGATSLSRMVGLLHEKTAEWVNRHNFLETRLTYERSYLARLN